MRTFRLMKSLALSFLAAAAPLTAAEPFVTTAPVVRVWPGVAPGSVG